MPTIEHPENVKGNAIMSGNAIVTGNAIVSGNALVRGNADVSGNAIVSGNADVSGNAIVRGNARVSGNARVRGSDLLHGGDLYLWTAYPNASDGREEPDEITFQYGCETHPLHEWTEDLCERLCSEHNPDATPHLARVLRTVRAYFSEHPANRD